jgi:hypothetical protein
LPGAFDASPECGYDPLRTAEEIQRSGEDVLRWLEALATSKEPARLDLHFVREVHRRWFDTTFPADAGRDRTEMVLNRKGTAVQVDAIMPGVQSACDNWEWRRANVAPDDDDAAFIEFAISEANTLTVAIYDVHPFIDGNTRTTWHVRNYALMLDGLRPLVDLRDEETYLAAWWKAMPHDHAELDYVVLQELDVQDR